MATTLSWSAPALAVQLPDQLSKGSYYVTLGLFVMTVPGLWSLIKRSTKSKIKRKTFEVPGPARKGAMSLDERAKQITAYFLSYNYRIKSMSDVIEFVGNFQSSLGQASQLVLYTFFGLASMALVLSIEFPGVGNYWYFLTLISPLSGYYYWTRANREEEVKVKLVTSDDDVTTEIIIEGDEEELDRFRKELKLQEKGKIYIADAEVPRGAEAVAEEAALKKEEEEVAALRGEEEEVAALRGEEEEEAVDEEEAVSKEVEVAAGEEEVVNITALCHARDLISGSSGHPESRQEGERAIALALKDLKMASPPQPVDPENMTVARRPAEAGKAGRPVRLLANFFAMNIGLETAHMYDVEVRAKDEDVMSEGDTPAEGPQLLPTAMNREIIDICAKQHKWPAGWVYDGKKIIYTAKEIFPRTRSTYEISLKSDNRDRPFEVGVKHARTIGLRDWQRYLERNDIPKPRDVIQCIEVLLPLFELKRTVGHQVVLRFSSTQKPNCYVIGRSIYFDDSRQHSMLSGSAVLWHGYHQGVKLTQNGLSLNIESTCAAFIKPCPILEIMDEAVGGNLNAFRQASGRKKEDMRVSMERAIKSIMIKTTHRDDQKKHRIVRLTKLPADQETFDLKDGSTKTVAAYWSEKYGPLRFPWLPCIDLSKNKKRLKYLPPEVCEVTPGQRIRKTTEDQTREMIKISARKPVDRITQIRESLHKTNIGNDPTAKLFGVSVDQNLAKVQGRILDQPHLQYGFPESMDTGRDGAWNLEKVRFFKPSQIKSWAIVSLYGRRPVPTTGENGLQSFMEEFMRMLSQMGLEIPSGGLPPLSHREQRTSLEETLNEAIQKAMNSFNSRPDIVLVILERRETDLYQDVKRIAESKLGIVTQCIVAQKAGIGFPSKGRLQYLANLAMKINHKTAGVNTQIVTGIGKAFPVLGRNQNKPFIVFGADVTHPQSFDENEPSVGAVVASMDAYLGQFAARVLALGHREERMTMHEAITDLFKQFYKRNNVKPEAVFFYRDGLSEGQFEGVMFHEYNEIRKACESLDPQYKPPITLITVQKMHHTRFFPEDPSDGDRNGNIRPGTCVDTGITSKYEFDFYLNSHAGIQGTNKPAHYYVLVDENGFGADGLQMFTYWQCYLYCRCTRSVSYVPAAYYAHLAALHGRYIVTGPQSSSTEASNGSNGNSIVLHANLNDKMFFV